MADSQRLQFEYSHSGIRLVGDRWMAREPRGQVVLLHGAGQTRHSWQLTAARLSQVGWSTLTLDARGHGDSDWDPAGDYSLDGFVSDLLAILDAQKPAVLVGASLGGLTALVAAGEHRALVRGLVLVDVVVNVECRGAARVRDFLTAHQDGFASLEDVGEAIDAYNPRRRRRNLDGLRKNVRQRTDGRWYWHWDPRFVAAPDESSRGFDPQRLRAAALALAVPTMLVRGAQSDLVSDAGMEDMGRLIPSAEIVTIQRAGHMLVGDDNDAFTMRVGSFLERLASGG